MGSELSGGPKWRSSSPVRYDSAMKLVATALAFSLLSLGGYAQVVEVDAGSPRATRPKSDLLFTG